LWKKAAQVAHQARQTLADPAKKAQLDARFGIVAIADAEPQPESNPTAAVDPLASVLPAADPLAGVLPSADPLAAVLPTADPLEAVPPPPSAAPVPDIPAPQLPGSPPAKPGGPVPTDLFSPASPATGSPASIATVPVVVKPKKKGRRRRQSAISILLFALFAIGMLGLIGLLGYVVLSEGQLAITSTDRGISISTQQVDEEPTNQVGPPRPLNEARRPPREFDPVMGSLAGDVPPPNRPPESTGLLRGIDMTGEGIDMTGEPLEDSSDMNMESPLGELAPAPPSEPESAPPSEPESEPLTDATPEPATQPPTDEMIAEADQTLERVRTLIREANWSEMKAAAEAAAGIRMNDQQQGQAKAIYELAELASYYRGGIERAIADQDAGNEIEVNEIRLVVVETGDDLLVVKLNGRNKTYKFDDIPLSLAHKLARFEIPDSPTGQAAKAAYQAIVPKTTPDYRAQAIDWLREITDPVEGADPQRMAETIEALFGAADN
jgi:hypothetical protein